MKKKDRIIELLTAVRYTTNDIEKVAEAICLLFDVINMLPSKYSWQKHQWKNKGNLKTTIIELVNIKDLSKKELILLIELIKDHLGN